MIFVVGYFGYETNQLDGQTIKTRNVYELLQKHCGELSYYDTQRFRKNPLTIFTLLFNACRCNKLILLPAQNNLTILFPVLHLLSKIFRYEIIHIAIGGWLSSYCRDHLFIKKLLHNNRIILLENTDVINSLKTELGLTNTAYLHNYRQHNYIPTFTRGDDNSPLRIVFMARIHRLKGLDIIFEIADHYSNSANIVIDFYGQINPTDEEYFKDSVAKYNYVNYCGSLQPNEIYDTLNSYDLMILPTRYYTEGFPGSILDAYISGIPVLVSNWKHAHEFVFDGYNGFICNVDKTDEFINVVDKLINNREMLLQLKHNAFESSAQYSSNAAWEILKPHVTA